MFINNREWEIQILSGIERLVHILIEASYAKGLKKSDLLSNAVSHLRNLNPLLLKLVDGKEEHLESLIRQLFSQKLPPGFILTSFGGLKRDLDFVIREALIPLEPEVETLQQAEVNNESVAESIPEPDPDPQIEKVLEEIIIDTNHRDENISDENISDNISEAQVMKTEKNTITQDQVLNHPSPSLADIITNFYPGEEVVKDYSIRSVSIDYYLPNRKIAYVLMLPGKKIYKMHRLLLKQEGITLIEVNPGELNNIRLLARHLPKF